MGANHSHSIPSTHNERALTWALGLTSCFLLIEFVAAWLLNSLALLADAAHMLTDAAALAIALVAMKIARYPADYQRTYGYYRFEILAAAFNALLLFAVAIYIFYETYQRFYTPENVHSTGMIVVALIGLIINFISLQLLSKGKGLSLNLKGAYLEVWSDMLGSIAVIIGAIFIKYFGWPWIDSVVAIGIGLWVLPRTWELLKESLNILLEGVPEGMNIDEVKQAIEAVPNVVSVHDLHVWGLTSGKNVLTAHVVRSDKADPDFLIESIQVILASRFYIFHVTLQTELTPCKQSNNGCHFS